MLRCGVRFVSGDRHLESHREAGAKFGHCLLAFPDGLGFRGFAEPGGESIASSRCTSGRQKLEHRSGPEDVEILSIGVARVTIAITVVTTPSPCIIQSCEAILVEAADPYRSGFLPEHAVVKDDQNNEADRGKGDPTPCDGMRSEGHPANE